MEEVFQVWQNSQHKILHSMNKKINAGNQEYMHEQARPIYHLDLQVRNKNAPSSKQGDANISGQFSKLSVNENIPLEKASSASQPMDEQGGSFNPVAPPPKEEFFSSPLSNEWFYIDPSGNEQGPFNSDVMQEWFMSGYLALDLNVRRKNEPVYQTLRQVCESQNNFTTPFAATSLLDLFSLNEVMTPSHEIKPSVGVQNQLDPFFDENASGVASPGINMNTLTSQPSFFNNNILGQSEGSLSNPVSAGAAFSGPRQTPFENVATGVNYGNNFSNGLPQMNQFNNLLQQQSGGLLSQNHNGWNIDDPTNLMAGTPENSTSIPRPLSNISPQHPMSSFLSGMPTQSRVGSPFAPGSSIVPNDGFRDIDVNQKVNSLNQAPEDNLLHQLQNSMMTDLLNENANDKSVSDVRAPGIDNLKATSDEDNKSKDMSTSFGDMRLNQTSEKQEVLQNELNLKSAVGEQETTAKAHTSSPPAAPAAPSKAFKDEISSPEVSADKKSPPKKQSKEEKKSSTPNYAPSTTAASTTPYAPWANATADAQERQSKPSMTLKDIQNLEVERAKEQQHIEDTIRKEQLLKESKEKGQVSTPKNILPKTSSWGANNNSKTPVVTKTLGEIQKEEAKAREQSKASAPSTASHPASFAAALANSKPRGDESWTFVAPKKTVQKKPSQVHMPTSAATPPKSTASPQYLRAVSAAAPASTNVNSNLLMEDFLSWARSSMANLYPTVSKDGLLDVFVALPLNKDSSLIIAESIYGASTTMDGRRFASEFLKRRQKLENQIGHQDARVWSSAIQSSAVKLPTVDEEGWSTSWKAGKKGKKA